MKQRLGVCIFILLCMAAVSQGQSPTAIVNGQVRDASGAAITGATVEVFNDATHVRYSTETNDEGIYSVPSLPPGVYHIQVSKAGFKTVVHPEIALNVQDAKAIGFTLPVGPISDIVTVEGGAPLVNTESAAVSTVIDRNFVENLPLNGRSFNTLLQLTPGVVIAPSNTFSPGQFSIAGQRTNANSFSVDGVSANFGVVADTPSVRESGTGAAQAFSAIGGTSSLVSVEALQEFRIETSSFAPELGRSPGGQVILTTRPGTNNFHGGGYEYFRNDVLDSNNWFANAVGKPRAPERHNDFGGFLGGRILKDKTFFFLSYEGARLRLPQSRVRRVPSAYARSYAKTNAPALAPFLDAYPLPDDRTITAGVYVSPFTGVWSNRATLDAGSVRIDHTFNSRFSIFGRYNEAPSGLTTRVKNLSTLSPVTVNTRTMTIGLNAFLSSRTSNTLRANYSTQRGTSSNSLDSFGGAVPPPSSLLLGPLSGQQNRAALFTSDSSSYLIGPNTRNGTRQINLSDDLSFAVSTHQMKYGVDYRVIDLDSEPYQHAVYYLPGSIQAFLSSNGKASLRTITTAPAQVRSQSLSLYAQDSWKASRRLTLTYGIRWELSPAPAALGTTRLASWTNVDNPSQLALAPSGTPTWHTSYGNFAPRIGLAYALTDGGDFVLRAGGGVFYDLGVGSSVVGFFPNIAGGFAPGKQLPIADATPYLPVLSVQPPYPDGITYGFSPNLKLARSYQWNIALEKSFRGKQVISATYLGQAGRDLLRQDVTGHDFSALSRWFFSN